MFIHLDALEDHLTSIVGNQHYTESLRLIALCHYEGCHIIYGRRDVLKKISDCLVQGTREHAVYMHACEQITQYGEYFEKVTSYISVGSLQGSPRVNNVHGRREYSVPLDYFSQSQSVQKTVLLGENLRDIKMYLIIANVFIINKHIPGFRISADKLSGHGQSIAETYKTHANNHSNPILAIVDSDKNCASCPSGATATELVREENRCALGCVKVLDKCKEIENLIALAHLNMVCEGTQTRVDSVDVVNALERSQLWELRFFLDFKKGNHYKGVLALSNQWKKNHLGELHKISMIDRNINNTCRENGQCQNPSSCECLFFNGFGTRLLENVVDKLEEMSYHKIAEALHPNIGDIWSDIGSTVFSWCCAISKPRLA